MAVKKKTTVRKSSSKSKTKKSSGNPLKKFQDFLKRDPTVKKALTTKSNLEKQLETVKKTLKKAKEVATKKYKK